MYMKLHLLSNHVHVELMEMLTACKPSSCMLVPVPLSGFVVSLSIGNYSFVIAGPLKMSF